MNNFGNKLFAYIGLAWALLGVANLVLAEQAWMGLSLMFNVPLHIIPGLIVFALFISRKTVEPKTDKPLYELVDGEYKKVE